MHPSIESAKALLGVILKDWRRYQRALDADDNAYLGLCNRYERLESAPDGSGFRCDWQWTSQLHAPKYVPSLGRRLMRRALADRPVDRRATPTAPSDDPDITFLIGHRGMARLPHLLATIESIAAQRNASLECLVIEQDADPLVRTKLPDWVRYAHTPLPAPNMPYCRAWAFNVGARYARGRILVLHDNDMLIPVDYASEILRRKDEGFETINLKRFIFYLGEQHTRDVIAGTSGLDSVPPSAILQNAEAGGSIAISRMAYDRIGGMDETFVGWGGEDNEFWERAQTLRVWPFGYLPMVHLWHAPQSGRLEVEPATIAHHRRRSLTPVDLRIGELRARDFGNPLQTDPPWPQP
jgi:hypothetical protein